MPPRAGPEKPEQPLEVYGRMAAERNDFNVNLSDTIYSDSEVGGAPFARTLAQKWAKYRLGLALPALRRLRASAALYSHWDDHEFVNDFSPRARRRDLRGRGPGVPRLRARVRGRAGHLPHLPGEALGALLPRRALLPERQGDGCLRGDLAPTLPQAVRDAFAALAPALRTVPPASQQSPTRRGRYWGRQYAAFTRAIARSTATWKVVVNEVPIQQYYALPYDRWEGYAAERAAPPVPPGEREERRLPDDGLACELRQRGAPSDARGITRELGHLGGRDRTRGDEHVLE